MTSIYHHKPHPQIEARKLEGAIKIRHTAGKGFNDRLGMRITKGVGTMYCAYGFTVLALVSLPSVVHTGSLTLIVAWIAQTFLQLVLLSVILVGQNLTGIAGDKRADQTYKDAEAVLAEAIKIQEHLAIQDEILTKLSHPGSLWPARRFT